ncbi:MAG TPA: hypothetical protein VFX16_32950 [Pseudonocardiaceae bacterium]|nr:hypothetical protein [Pseudonocardiaceae bacterium]
MGSVEPLPYERKSDPAHNAVATDTSRVRILPDERDPEEIVIEGPCPRCRHDMAYREPVVSYRDVNWAPIRDLLFDKVMRELAAAERKRDVTVFCRCGQYHPDSPRGEEWRGCGAFWKLTVEWGE